MKYPRLNCLFIGLLLYACNTTTTTDAAITVTDTAGVVVDSTTVYDTSFPVMPKDTPLIGFYQGVLPCKDCQGIKHTLLLGSTGIFRLEEFTLGKDIFPKKQEGRWMRANDSLRLLANQKLVASYYIKGDTLLLAYFDGRPSANSVVKNHAVVRQPAASANVAWKKKRQEGVDFFAVGNEPFWSLEIDKEGSIVFRPADLPKPIAVAYRAPNMNKDSAFYSLNVEGSPLQVTIYNEFCNDGMSDNFYEHRVEVRYKGEVLKGCGNYLR
jgi:uncharacterized membrane protein